MSSAVNKSQKRFMPSMASRGPGARGPSRRVSTLRTSFSVPNSQKVQPSPSQNTNGQPYDADNSSDITSTDAVALIRSQLLGGVAKGMDSISESAVEDTITPSAKRTRTSAATKTADPKTLSSDRYDINSEAGSDTIQYSPQPSTSYPGSINGGLEAKNMNTTRVVNSSSSLRPTISTPRPFSTGSIVTTPRQPIAASNSTETQSSTRPTSEPTSSMIPKRPVQKPEAPEGFEYIWPEDLPNCKKEERRRKQAVEKELLAIMKELYAERETKQLLEDHAGMNEEVAKALGEEAASTATYHQLKQKVGPQAKEKRDKRMQEDQGPETPKEGETKTLLDVNKFTMASLCRDIPVGDMNPTYDDYELARINRRRDTLRIFRAKMWSRRMYEPKDSEKAELKEAYLKYQRDRIDRTGKIKSEQEQKFTEIDHDSQTVDSLGGHPQASIEIQADGSISLVGTQFDRHKNNRTQREGGTSGPKTEVDPTEQRINSASFSTRERPDRWTAEETEKFYSAVSALGTDFNMIAHLFPLRSRNQIKTKYKYEEKRNPAKLQIHLVSRRKFNLESYSKVSKIAIQDVNSIEDELEKVREEHKKQMEIEAESRLMAKAEDQKNKDQSKPSSRPKRERKD